MPYSSWGDFICGAFVLIIIIFHFLNKSKKNTALKSVLFILVSVLIFNVLHGVSDLLVYNKVTLKLALIFKYLSIIVFSIIASGFEIYCLGVIKDTTKILKWHYLILVLPVLWNIIWLIINKITNICFEVEGNTIIYHVAYCLLFLCFIFAMIYMPIMCLVYKRGIYPSLFKVGLTFTIFSALFGIFQFFFSFFINNNVFFTSVFLTLSTAYTYLYSRNDLINIDQMTNLYMRNKCMDDLTASDGVSVYMLEIMRFHHFSSFTGDQILIEIVNFLKTIFNKYTMYRVSSNQIIVIVGKSDDISKISLINREFRKPINIQGDDYSIDIKTSIIIKKKNETAEHTVYLLEKMINQIKDTNEVFIVYSSEMKRKLEIEENDTNKIIKAINKGSVVPYYQGIYSINDEKITWCEALARLNVNGEIIPPSKFIPILENHRCVNKLDRNMLCQVLKELKSMNDSGTRVDVKGISINFTAEDILNQSFIDEIKQMVKNQEIDPNMISFEICESVIISNFQKAKEIMEELNSYGIKFFLDDFGTGFSNLKAVLSLPFYLIKIDKSLLDAAKENTRNQQILDGVVKAINSIGMKTLIEGVETKEDVELVKNFGVNYIQGYYYHKPSNMTELNKTIEEKV